MRIRYTGEQPKVYRDLGGIHPGEEVDVPEDLARRLIAGGEPFEVAQKSDKQTKAKQAAEGGHEQ